MAPYGEDRETSFRAARSDKMDTWLMLLAIAVVFCFGGWWYLGTHPDANRSTAQDHTRITTTPSTAPKATPGNATDPTTPKQQ